VTLAKALGRQNNPVPRVINTDGHSAYPPAIVRLKAEGALVDNCRHRPVPYLNNVLEQDHRSIKRRGPPAHQGPRLGPMLGFNSVVLTDWPSMITTEGQASRPA
jgi:transposase-like protein